MPEITDRSLIVRSWDGWLADATGLSSDAACGTSLLELYPDIATRGLERHLKRVIAEGAVTVLAPAFHGYLIPCPPPRPSPYFERMQQRVTLTPLRAGESIEGVIVRIEDVTERRDDERRFAERLGSGDESVRLEAVREAAAGTPRAEVLANAFGDGSWRVRNTAAKAAAQDESETAADVFIELLRERHRDLAVLNAAITAVANSRADVLPRLLPLLHEPDEDLRTYVALALGLLGNADAVPPLIELIGDESANVRFHALEALGRLADQRAVEALLPIVEARDFFLAPAACEALGRIGDEGVTPIILPLLRDPMLAPVAVDAVGLLGGVEAIEPIALAIADGLVGAEEVAIALSRIHRRLNERGGGNAVLALVRAHLGSGAVAELVAGYPSSSPEGRCAIVTVISWLDEPAVDRLLIQALDDADTQPAAVEGLILRGARSVEALSVSLDRLEEAACAAAIVALGRIGSPSVVPTLNRLLDARPELSVTIAGALGGIGSRDSLEALLGLLDCPDPAVRQAAVGALNSIGHPELPDRIAALVGSPSARVRESAARIVCYFGFTGAFEAVMALTHDPVESVRRTAIEHLVSFDEPEVTKRIAEALREDAPAVKAAAARALGLADDAAVPELLMAGLADKDLWVRYHAARSAGPAPTPEVLERLRDMAVHDDVVPVRIAAIGSLAASGDEGSVPLLVEIARDTHQPELEREALAALARIPSAAGEAQLVEALRRAEDDIRLALLEARTTILSPALREAAVDLATSSLEPHLVEAALTAVLRAGATPADLEGFARAAADSTGRAAPRRRTIIRRVAAFGDMYLAGLAALLKHEDERVRFVCMEILSRIDHPHLAQAIAPALRDTNPEVARLANLMLDRLDLREMVASTVTPGVTRETAVRR